MTAYRFARSIGLVCILLGLGPIVTAQGYLAEAVRGTLVTAVPYRDGLAVCADKRLFNAETGTSTDDNVKIRRVGRMALFAATNTVGFYDHRARKMAFDAFQVTSDYTATNEFSDNERFWQGLKDQIRARLRSYFAGRPYAEWPPSDRHNGNLLFNLVFYSVRDERAWSYSIKVFYEKARTPVIQVSGPISEEVKTTKLSGKGREVMAFLAANPDAAADPSIQKFDESRFDVQSTSDRDAVDFARKLIRLTSTGVPRANVSPVSDCALLSYSQGFRWLG